MDSYVEEFQKAGGSMIMLAKGNRSRQVLTDACVLRHNSVPLSDKTDTVS